MIIIIYYIIFNTFYVMVRTTFVELSEIDDVRTTILKYGSGVFVSVSYYRAMTSNTATFKPNHHNDIVCTRYNNNNGLELLFS